MELIEAKRKGQEIVAPPAPPGKVIDLMAALRQSVEAAKKRRPTGTSERRRDARRASQGQLAMPRTKRGAISTEYAAKRRLERTAEPPAERKERTTGPLQFVIHKHAARRLHYDLRLEVDGAFKSWAVPKGPSLEPEREAAGGDGGRPSPGLRRLRGRHPGGRVRRRRGHRLGPRQLRAGGRRPARLRARRGGGDDAARPGAKGSSASISTARS